MISLYTIFGNNNLQIIRLIVFWFEFYGLRGIIILPQNLVKQNWKFKSRNTLNKRIYKNLNKTIDKYSFKEQSKNTCFILRHVFLNIYIDYMFKNVEA